MGGRSGQIRWLVIDADPASGNAFSAVLQHYGCEVTVVASARRGIDFLSEREVEGIICDAHLPRMDGFELCDELRREERTARIPFFLVSTNWDASEQHIALQVGARDVITKPLDERGVHRLATGLRRNVSAPRPTIAEPLPPLIVGTPVGSPPRAPATAPSDSAESCQRCGGSYSMPAEIQDSRQLLFCPTCLGQDPKNP